MISIRPRTDDPLAVARHHAAQPATWPVLPRFDPAQRWYTRIDGGPGHEVWLLTWLPGQGTDLHDHGGCSGAFQIVTGELTEETVSNGQLRPVVLTAGTGRRFGPRHVHRVTNTSDRPAVSIHVYRPALRRMTRYHLADGLLMALDVAEAGVAW